MIDVYERLPYNKFEPKQKWYKLGRPKRCRLTCYAVAIYASTIKAQRLMPFDTDSSHHWHQ